jgi:hypothetical protein
MSIRPADTTWAGITHIQEFDTRYSTLQTSTKHIRQQHEENTCITIHLDSIEQTGNQIGDRMVILITTQERIHAVDGRRTIDNNVTLIHVYHTARKSEHHVLHKSGEFNSRAK